MTRLIQKTKIQINIDIKMPTYNLIEYSDNYSDASGSLCQFKRDEIEGNVWCSTYSK